MNIALDGCDRSGARSIDLIGTDIGGSECFALRGMAGLLLRAGALAVECLPFHLRDVANVSITQFAETIVRFFEVMSVPGRAAIAGRVEMIRASTARYEAGEKHDLIYFTKAADIETVC